MVHTVTRHQGATVFSVEFINVETDYRREQLRRAWGGRPHPRKVRRHRPAVRRDEPASAVVVAPVAEIEEPSTAVPVSSAV